MPSLQLANVSSTLKDSIYEAVAEHNDIANQALLDQWNQLVFRPLSKLETSSLQLPLIFVVDTLDECEDEKDIRMILQLLGDARALRTVRLRIFVAPHSWIPQIHGWA